MLRVACPHCATVNEAAEPIGDSTFECGRCGQVLFAGEQPALPVAVPMTAAPAPVRCYDCDSPIPEGLPKTALRQATTLRIAAHGAYVATSGSRIMRSAERFQESEKRIARAKERMNPILKAQGFP